MHKAGFVNIVGNPNVGKSTLMNQLVGERISIATFKAQTTRHRIMGIVNTDDMHLHVYAWWFSAYSLQYVCPMDVWLCGRKSLGT